MISDQELNDIIARYKKIERGDTVTLLTDFFTDDLLPILVELRDRRRQIKEIKSELMIAFKCDEETEALCPVRDCKEVCTSHCHIYGLFKITDMMRIESVNKNNKERG